MATPVYGDTAVFDLSGCRLIRVRADIFVNSRKLLEIIVTSAEEAREAEQGGADRLELVSDLASEGLTPALGTVEEVLGSVSVPVRVMFRSNESFHLSGTGELDALQAFARETCQMPIDGIVLGYIKEGGVDFETVERLLACCGTKPATFHRAIESVTDQQSAIAQLRKRPQIDHILTCGGPGSWITRRATLELLQQWAAPEITILAGGGLTQEGLAVIAESPVLKEFHIGRAARDSSLRVRSNSIQRLRSLLG
jgi:copper homeostasis protein